MAYAAFVALFSTVSSLRARRYLWWCLRTTVAAIITGLVIGSIIVVGGSLQFWLVAWMVGGTLGIIAGLGAGLLGATIASVVAPDRYLASSKAFWVGALACFVVSLALMLSLYASEMRSGTFGAAHFVFASFIAAIGGTVGGWISIGTEDRVARGTGLEPA